MFRPRPRGRARTPTGQRAQIQWLLEMRRQRRGVRAVPASAVPPPSSRPAPRTPPRPRVLVSGSEDRRSRAGRGPAAATAGGRNCGRDDARERHPFTLIAHSSVWSAELRLQEIRTSVTDKANGRSPEESQEALLSAANTVKCVGDGSGRCRASRPGGGEHGRRERDQRPRRVWTRRSPGGVARAGSTRVAPVAPPGPSPSMSGPVPSRVEETRAGAEVVLDGTADCGAAYPHPGEAGLRRASRTGSATRCRPRTRFRSQDR